MIIKKKWLLNRRLKEKKKKKIQAIKAFCFKHVHCVLPLAGGSSMTLLSCRDQGHAMLSREGIYTSATWIKREMLAFISAWHPTPLAPLSAEKPAFILHVSLASLNQSWSFLYVKSACCRFILLSSFKSIFMFIALASLCSLFSDLPAVVTSESPWCVINKVFSCPQKDW